MATHRFLKSTTATKAVTASRLSAALLAVALLVSACGSTDDGGTEVVSQAEAATPAPATPAPATPVPATPVPTKAPTTVPASTTAPTAAPIPIEAPDLVGQNWYVQAVDSASGNVLPRPNGAVAQIQFNADGSITGNAACNSFTANYTVDGAALSITNFAITKMNCFIPDWSAFVEFLPKTTGYGSAGGPDPILFVGTDGSIALGSTPPEPNQSPADPASTIGDYIGLAEIEAAQLADTRGVAFRVSSIDGAPQALTMDYNAERVNVDLVNGTVVSGTQG